LILIEAFWKAINRFEATLPLPISITELIIT